MLTYLAAEGFSNDLREELNRAGVSYKALTSDLFVADDGPLDPVWARDVWTQSSRIEFSSVSDASKKLLALGPKLWALHSTKHHRRASLVVEKLPNLRPKTAQFLDPLAFPKIGRFSLLEPQLLLASPEASSPFPLGEVRFHEDREAPSRAYLKLWELFTVHGVRPDSRQTALELGASPGGWTWVLAKLGMKVTAVDRASLDPKVEAMPGVSTLKRDAFSLSPEEFGPVDWLFSDLICYPQDIEELIHRWSKSGNCRNFVCTIKYQGPTDFETSERLLRDFPGSRLKHLHHNKHEATWWWQAPEK